MGLGGMQGIGAFGDWIPIFVTEIARGIQGNITQN
jgi:hypothetical protein